MSTRVEFIFSCSSKMRYCHPVNRDSPPQTAIESRYARATGRSFAKSIYAIGCGLENNWSKVRHNKIRSPHNMNQV